MTLGPKFRTDVAIIGAGHVGLPWAVTLAKKRFDVVCVDTDENRVNRINEGTAPFQEPGLGESVERTVSQGRLTATTDPAAVSEASVVAICINCPVNGDRDFLDAVSDYAEYVLPSQVLINRTTLPLKMVDRTRRTVAEQAPLDPPHFCVYPERLAEGTALSDIESIPNVVGVDSGCCREIMELLLADFDSETLFTDPLTAMFVKLIDNSWRTTLFALANYYATISEAEGIDVYEAIRLANHGFRKTDVPQPGTVGGKCLLKDTQFLSGEYVRTAVNTPDLFRTVKDVHDKYEQLVVDRVTDHDPDRVALLGTAYNRDVSNETGSPGLRIKAMLEDSGITVDTYDPYVPGRDAFESSDLDNADVVVVAMNHSTYERQWERIQEHTGGRIVDVWGIGDRDPSVDRVGDRT